MYRLADNHDDPNAMVRMAEAYIEGLHGLAPDRAKAYYWLRRAQSLVDDGWTAPSDKRYATLHEHTPAPADLLAGGARSLLPQHKADAERWLAGGITPPLYSSQP